MRASHELIALLAVLNESATGRDDAVITTANMASAAERESVRRFLIDLHAVSASGTSGAVAFFTMDAAIKEGAVYAF